MPERKLLQSYYIARGAYDAAPSYAAAMEVLRAAQTLVAVSDDYQELLDEADDLVSEPVDQEKAA